MRSVIAILLVGVVAQSVLAVDSPPQRQKDERLRRYQQSGVTERWERYRQDYLDINNLPPPEDGQLLVLQGGQLPAVHRHRAGGGPVQASQDVHQR